VLLQQLEPLPLPLRRQVLLEQLVRQPLLQAPRARPVLQEVRALLPLQVQPVLR
jgi:hypothetical protein